MTATQVRKASWTRDENGIPQILAEDIQRLHWGMGYCHAMDRGMPMLIMRILGQGRAAELLDGSDEMVEVERLFVEMVQAGIDDDHLEALFPGSTDGLDRAMVQKVELGERIVPTMAMRF